MQKLMLMETGNKSRQGFKPGEGGRPKGVKNKITREIQAKVEWVLGLLDETAEEDLKKMKPQERIRLWADLQEFIRPKLQRTNVEIGAKEDNAVKFTFEVVPSGRSND